MEKIKLVIWDLDETFWNGTLSEGEVSIVDNNIRTVKELTKRGIINSIASKNDYELAKAKLVEIGVWDYFVFPSINWNPKGENIKGIIQNCQLRAPNVLFIDDNIINLKEVEFYNPGINVMDVKMLDSLLDLAELKGKDDSSLSRLNQYKILEKKYEFKQEYSDNHSFLLQSDIKVSIDNDIESNIERVTELIERTNQLNFTKKRIGKKQVQSLIFQANVKCGIVRVNDRFGDYGICGFYALNTEENVLEHFVFSCRILNLGVENYIYRWLGCPKINIVHPVASSLDDNTMIDWISMVDSLTETIESKKYSKKRILFMGGCDLLQLCHYIDGNKFEVVTDFNYPNKRGVPVHREHTTYLRNMLNKDKHFEDIIKNLPFGDANFNKLNFLKGEYDVLVYSVLMNYTHALYTNSEFGFNVAYGGYMDENQMFEKARFTRDEIKMFSKEYVYKGLQTPEEFMEDLEFLSKKVNKTILFLNGAEVENDNPNEIHALERHRIMNKALETFVANHKDKCKIIDVRKFVLHPSDTTNSIRHYQRGIYIRLAQEVMCSLNVGGKIPYMLLIKAKYGYFKKDFVKYLFKLKSFVLKLGIRS